MTEEEFVMPFGKYEGKSIKDLPLDYMEWLLQNREAYFKHKRPELYAAIERLVRIKEQDGILLPWQPKSHKPTLPFVICTNGEGHYWIGRYHDYVLDTRSGWQISIYYGWDKAGIFEPVAWIEPEKFVPFVKKKELHMCENHEWGVRETLHETLNLYHKPTEIFLVCKNCPFCGFKAGEK